MDFRQKMACIIIIIMFGLVGCGETTPEETATDTPKDTAEETAMEGNTEASDIAVVVHDDEAVLETTEDTTAFDDQMEGILETAEAVEEAASETTSETYDADFFVVASNYKYELDGVEAPELRVKKGDTVRLQLSIKDGFHDWVVDGVAATAKAKAGELVTITFVAENAGTYEYYCSVGSHRAMGMKGTFVVE